MRMDQAWVYNRHYLLHRNDFPVGQRLRAQLLVGSAALVLGSILISALFHFGGFGSDIWLHFALVDSVWIYSVGKVWQVAVV